MYGNLEMVAIALHNLAIGQIEMKLILMQTFTSLNFTIMNYLLDLMVVFSNLQTKEILLPTLLEIWPLVNFTEYLFLNKIPIKLPEELKTMVDLHISMNGAVTMEVMVWKV